MVGFNRRFAPLIKLLKSNLDNIYEPKAYIYICNAGFIGKDHWTQNPKDWRRKTIRRSLPFCGPFKFSRGIALINQTSNNKYLRRNEIVRLFSIQIKFKNGSIGTIHYLSNGNKKYPKERLKFLLDKKYLY